MSAVLHGDARVAQLRVPPQAVDAEQAVLGGLLLAGVDALADVADRVGEDDFYRADHRLLWRAIRALADKGEPFDAVTVAEWLAGRELAGQLDPAYVVQLAATTPSAANVAAYAGIVRDRAQLRELITLCTEGANAAYLPGGREADAVVADVAGKVAALTQRGSAVAGLRMLRGTLQPLMEDLHARLDGSATLGLQLPWPGVAEMIPGLEDTDLMVLAARPSMGKTAMALQIADAAAGAGRNVAVFSLEMSDKQLSTRLLSMRSRVELWKFRKPDAMDDADWTYVVQAMGEMCDLPLAIDDTASLTIDAIRARAARMHAKVDGGLGLIVVDYLQLISGGGNAQNRNDEVSAISRGLKLLAKDLRCPVIALSQLNRTVEQRTDKRPIMSDLRESGAIEQDADVIAFLFRDDYYTKADCKAPGISELIIAKQRQGPTGTAYLRHDLAHSSFHGYDGPRPDYRAGNGAGGYADGFDDVPDRRRGR